jgi:hypothetical protein
MREPTFWKATASALAALLAAMLLVDASGALSVPPEARAFVFSCLVCVGVGATVVSPRSSPVRLDAATERAVRGRQTVVALTIAFALALLLLVPEVRRGPLPWFLAPIIALGSVLFVRRWFQRRERSA